MISDNMKRGQREVEKLINLADKEQNPVEFIQVNNLDHMKDLHKALDGYARDCTRMFMEWQEDYVTLMDTTIAGTLKQKLTKFKEDLCEYTRDNSWPSALAFRLSLSPSQGVK
jgi:hypothetical protein